MPLTNYYDLLGVPPTASQEEVKRAFRQQIARYHPDKVQHLGKEFQAMAANRAADLDARGLAALNSSDEVKLTRHRDATGLAGAARGMLAQQNDRVIQSLDKIAVPTLVLVGANDTNFLAATDYMAAKIKGATKAVVPDAGHAANLHQPALFNQAVEAFLAKLPAV